MTEATNKPRKTLSIIRKPAPVAATPETATTKSTRTTKRIITRDQLPDVQRPGKFEPRPKPPKKPANRKPRQPQKPPKTPPSELRARELNDSLNAFAVWREYQPLELGIEKQIFRIIADMHLSASKRVVQKLMHYHTNNRRYLQGIQGGGVRWNLDATEGGAITQDERSHATRALENI